MITCQEPEVPAGGYVVGYDFNIHSSIEYHCDPGHKLVGTSILQCNNNGEWSTTPPECLCEYSSLFFNTHINPRVKTYPRSRFNPKTILIFDRPRARRYRLRQTHAADLRHVTLFQRFHAPRQRGQIQLQQQLQTDRSGDTTVSGKPGVEWNCSEMRR